MSKIIIEKINIQNNRIDYKYNTKGNISHYINKKDFFIEYSECISSVPKSICAIPLICNFLPIVWVTNSELIIDELDKSFYNSISKFKKGYEKMYPKIKFNGKITVKKLINNTYKNNNKYATLFTGGVDATSTLVSNLSLKPDLITLWGSDVKLNAHNDWENVKKFLLSIGNQFNLKNVFIKTSFREVVNERLLTAKIHSKSGDKWWHGFQHGIAIIGHAAPYNYLNQISVLYIASSFTEGDNISCASDPTIDNHVKFASCSVIHDGYDLNRIEKLENINRFCLEKKVKINLRVCLRKTGVENCISCEKCYRTIYSLISSKIDPKLFGFNLDNNFHQRVKNDFDNDIILRHPTHWKNIQNIIISNKEYFKRIDGISWIFNYDFNPQKRRNIKYFNKLIKRIKMLTKKGRKR